MAMGSSEAGQATVMDRSTLDLAAATQLRNLEALRGGLEHELRSPLNQLVLNIELLRELTRAGGGDTALDQLERLDALSAAVERLQAGMSDVLAQLQSPGLEPEPFDLGEVAADLQPLLRAELAQRGVSLVFDATGEAMPVMGRRDALRLALLNVVLNAIEASPRGEQVIVTTRRVGGELVLEVRDSGEGIAPEAQPRVFERHFTTRDGRAGIGLFVARSLIEADAGRLELASSGTDGTRFTVRLPPGEGLS